MTLCYSSVFGESWTVSTHLGAKNVWRSVPACAPQQEETDF